MTDLAKAVAFLHEAATYFEKRYDGGEDKAFWANIYNGRNCRAIADRIEELEAALRTAQEATAFLLARLSDYSPDDDDNVRQWFGHVGPAIGRVAAVHAEIEKVLK